MKKLFILLSGFSLFCFASYSQSVGINTDASLPHASSMLDVKSINKGLLIPRITLTSTSDVITITSPAVSLMVYNTTAAGGGPTAVTPGFYFWNGTAWERLTPAAGISGSGTTNFVPKFTAATTLGNSAIFESGGNVGIGTTSPTDLLEVARNGSIDQGIHFGWNKMVLTNLHNMGIANNASHSIGSRILFKGYKDAALSAPQNIYSLGIDVFGNTISSVEKNNFFIRDEYASGSPVRFLIDATGNIGIGSTSPLQKLQVAGDINMETGGGIRINNTATSGQYLRGNGTKFISSAIQVGDIPAGSGNYIQNQTAADQAAGFRINGNGLFNGGNVGIGTISPVDRLEVAREGSIDLGGHFGWNKMVLTNLHNMGSANGGNHSIGSKILFRGYKDAALSSPQNIYSLGIDVFGDVTSSVEKNNFFIRDEYASGFPVRFLIDADGNVVRRAPRR